MKKILIILGIVFLIVVLGIWWYGKNNKSKENNSSNYQAEKSIATNNINTNNTTNNSVKINTNTTQNQIDTNDSQNVIPDNNIQNEVKPKTETQIAEFTTKIYGNDPARQNNMQITCNTLNNVEIGPGETFSFCDIGKATAEKGYQEADIFVDGQKKKGFGGGNCQISTTIYNAVAQIPELEVIERHNHSRDVKYIEKGKDAAVAYGSYDFKFKNNTDGVIRIVMEKTEKTITAKLIKIS